MASVVLKAPGALETPPHGPIYKLRFESPIRSLYVSELGPHTSFESDTNDLKELKVSKTQKNPRLISVPEMSGTMGWGDGSTAQA